MLKDKVLVIVESPKKIDTIKKYLPTDKEYIILASYGHIADLSMTGKQKLGIDLENNFALHYTTLMDKKEKLQAMINATTLCSKILIATDDDREGECIGSLIKDRIKSCGKPIKRIVFKEITKAGVLKGISEEREIDEQLVLAAKARRALDRIVGFLGSPYIIRKLGKNMSAGRVQSVALKLVVDREKEIVAFKPEEYWTVKANLAKFATEPFVATLHSKSPITNKDDAVSIKKELEGCTYKVSKITAKSKQRKPYPPLTTAKLQMVASTRFRMSPTKVMSAAQELYEQGQVTYIRTDSLRVSDEALASVRGWIKENYPTCLPDKANYYKNKNAAQDAHEAIRPSNINKLPEEKPYTDAEKVYKVIWDMFVASQMLPAVYDTVSVTINTDTKKELRANGRVLKEPGWLILVNNIEEDEGENKLPILIEEDVLTLVEPKISAEQKFTQPPSRYKAPTLIQELESKGIGRPSTYATIMQKICETRGFVEEKNTVYHPTDAGMKVVELLDKKFTFMEYEFTANMENKLDLIESGEVKYVDMMKEFYEPFSAEIKKAYQEYELGVTGDTLCTKCGGQLILKKSKYGFFLGCNNYPKCKNIVNCKTVTDDNATQSPHHEIEMKVFAPEETTCPICQSRMWVRKSIYGKYFCCINHPTCKGSRKIPFGKKCPECGDELYKTVFNHPPYLGKVLACMSYPKCNHVEQLGDVEEPYEKEEK